MAAMEIGDENLPPPDHSRPFDSVCAGDVRSPPAARSVLTDLNTSASEGKSLPDIKGPAEEEKCAQSDSVVADAEAEAWSERTAVITKYDHETHCQLARSFVEELADKVVEAKEGETKEELKDHPAEIEQQQQQPEDHSPKKKSEDGTPPEVSSLQKQKQSLFLPDLVPNVVIPQPQVPVTESESDEYESADEQPLHDTLYLDSTVNPPSSASTPIVDTPGHQLDFDLSTVVVHDEATVDASAKDYSLPVVGQPPIESIPQPEEGAEEDSDKVTFVKPFDRRRSTAPFSPSSGSDGSNVELEADTLAAQTPVRPPGDLDIDFISKFEKLVLTKQSSSESNAATEDSKAEDIKTEDNQTEDCTSKVEDNKEVEEKEDSSARLNETVPLEPAGEDVSTPADTTREIVLSETQDVPPTEEPAQATEEEEKKLSKDLSSPQSTEDPSCVPTSETAESTPEQVEQAAAADSGTETTADQTVSVTAVESDAVVEPVATDPVATDPVAPEPTTAEPGADEAHPVPAVEEVKLKPPRTLPEEKPIVPKKGYDLSFLDRFDDLENATPSISHLPLLPEVNKSKTNEEEEEQDDDHHHHNSPADETTSADPTVGEQVEGEDPNEVSDSSFKGDCTVKAVTPQPSPQKGSSLAEEQAIVDPSDAVVESAPKEPEGDCPSAPQSDSQPSEAQQGEDRIIPKKGYDLSFLDKLEDLEHASPTTVKEAKGNGSKGETAMKESMSATENVAVPSSDVAGEASPEAKPDAAAEEQSKPAKKVGAAAARKPIRPKFTRPPAAAAAKSDAFDVEFTFDPNEDPFKPKAKLGASPPRDQSDRQFDANTTVNAGEENTSGNEGDNTTVVEPTVIESETAEQSPPQESVAKDTAPAASEDVASEEEEFRPAQEVFQDPSALDFLMQHGGGCSQDNALARQSLFVKFDPLVTGRQSMFLTRPSDGGFEGAPGAEDKTTGRKSGSESLFLFSPPHPSSSARTEKSAPEAAGTAPEPAQQAQEQLMTGRGVSDDLVSLSEHKEALKLQELLFQDRLLQKEREIQMKENELQEVKAKLEATIEAQAQMRQIVGEYEKTISQLIAEKEREKAGMEANLQGTIKERDQAIEDLKEVERAFSEFHKMYERNRAAAEGLHKNEEALKKALTAYQERLQSEQHKYETLKLHAAQKLEGAQQEMENMKRNLESECSRVKAVLKKTEMKLASVETSLDQKTKENEELTKLCDELINKLGSSAK